MKLKRKIPYILVILMILIYLAAFVLCSLSVSKNLADDVLIALGHKVVSFSSGSFSPEEENIAVKLEAGETALLDEFTALRSADFSGSTCYEEIMQWSASHPDVSVQYTVALPNGQSALNSASALEIPGMRREDIPSLLSSLRYLPQVTSVNLGTSAQSSSPLSAADITELTTAYPSVSFPYAVELLGKSLPLDTGSIDLSGITSSDLPAVTAALSLLPNVNTIKFAENATTDGSLQWSDITAVSQAAPAATIDYHFSVCGVSATMADTSLDLSTIQAADIDSILAVLPGMTRLASINLGNESSGFSISDVDRLSAACPGAAISYQTSVYGVPVNLADEYLDLNHISISDEGAAVRQLLPHMKNLKGLDMDSCGVSDAAMAAIRDENPNVSVVWRIWFGTNYSCRTDVVKILASKPSKGGELTNGNTASLKYCTKVKYIDLGHNDDLTDFSFIACMPDLQIAVISITGVSDLTPFANCSELLYLEMGNTKVSDISPLANCTKLQHLNIGTNYSISDISPIYDLPLRRLWIGIADPVPQSQIDEYRSRHPECEVNTTCPSGNERDAKGNVINEGFTQDGWKTYQKYLTNDWNTYSAYGYFPSQRPLGYFKVVYLAYEYNLEEGAYAFSWNDPLYEPHGDDVQPVNMKVVDVSLLSQHWEEDPDIITPIYPEDESYG